MPRSRVGNKVLPLQAGLDQTEVRLRRVLFTAFSFGKLPESPLPTTNVYTLAISDGPIGKKVVFEAATEAVTSDKQAMTSDNEEGR